MRCGRNRAPTVFSCLDVLLLLGIVLQRVNFMGLNAGFFFPLGVWWWSNGRVYGYMMGWNRNSEGVLGFVLLKHKAMTVLTFHLSIVVFSWHISSTSPSRLSYPGCSLFLQRTEGPGRIAGGWQCPVYIYDPDTLQDIKLRGLGLTEQVNRVFPTTVFSILGGTWYSTSFWGWLQRGLAMEDATTALYPAAGSRAWLPLIEARRNVRLGVCWRRRCGSGFRLFRAVRCRDEARRGNRGKSAQWVVNRVDFRRAVGMLLAKNL